MMKEKTDKILEWMDRWMDGWMDGWVFLPDWPQAQTQHARTHCVLKIRG